MPQPVDFKLADLLGVAGASIGIIIAGAILMGNLGSKYVHLFERYRGLTGELRGNNPSDRRKGSLHEQIDLYRRRIRCMQVGSLGVSAALLLFILTVGFATLSVIYPQVTVLRWLGAAGLFAGLALIGVAVAIDLRETLLSRQAIGREVADFSDFSKE